MTACAKCSYNTNLFSYDSMHKGSSCNGDEEDEDCLKYQMRKKEGEIMNNANNRSGIQELDDYDEDQQAFTKMARNLDRLCKENDLLKQELIDIENERVKRADYEQEQREYRPSSLVIRAVQNGYIIDMEGLNEFCATNLVELLKLLNEKAKLLSPVKRILPSVGIVGAGLRR